MTYSNVSARRRARGGGDRSVLVIAFMMALVFVPVLATHAVVLAVGSEGSTLSLSEGAAQVAKLLERALS